MSGINETPDPKTDDVAELKKRIDALEHPVRTRVSAVGGWLGGRAARFTMPKFTMKDVAIFAPLLFLILRVGLPAGGIVLKRRRKYHG